MGLSHGLDWSLNGRLDRLLHKRNAESKQFDVIARELTSEWGITITASQCSAKYNYLRRQSDANVKMAPSRETKPTVEVGAPVDVSTEIGEIRQQRGSDLQLSSYCTPEPQSTIASNAPVVQTTKSRGESYLVVPDLQAPFQALGALEFCERVRKEFGVPKDNVLFTGDEADNFNGKSFDKKADPDAEHTPKQELRAAVDELKRWYAMYPNARLAVSNHGTRYERRAAEAEISSQWMRLYRDVIEAPPGWQWKDRWVIKASKHPFVLEHGHEGASRTEAKVLENGYSTVHGHFTKAQIVYVSNHLGRRLWGFCAAALIDHDTYAFRYAKRYPRKADNGVGVILDGGRIPLWVPLYGEAA